MTTFQIPESLPFGDIQYAPLTGHYYKLDRDTKLPEGLDVIADGKDVGGTHSRTHHKLFNI